MRQLPRVILLVVNSMIFFYKKLYASMSLDNLKAQIEEMVKKDHEWTKEQLDEYEVKAKHKYSQY